MMIMEKTRKMSLVFKSNPNKGLIWNHLGDQTITGMKGGKSGTVETIEFLGLKVGEIGEIGEIGEVEIVAEWKEDRKVDFRIHPITSTLAVSMEISGEHMVRKRGKGRISSVRLKRR